MGLTRALSRLLGPRFLKRWVPTSLYGRSLLIIILPMGVIQIAVTLLAFNFHSGYVTGQLSQGLAGEIASVVDSYREDPAALPRIAERMQKSLGTSVELKPGGLPEASQHNFFKSLDRSLNVALKDSLDPTPYWFETTRYDGYIAVRVLVDQGTLSFVVPIDRAFARKGYIFVLWLSGATLFLTLVTMLFIRNQVRAIERLADAAARFGRGGDVSAFKPHGAREVREAAQAFIEMKDNIQRHLEQRTALLASVSHDLRTPLTRLNLELALADPTGRTRAMKRDLSEMEHMIDEYLDFARGEGGEAVERQPLLPLIEAVADNARRAGAEVTVEGDGDLTSPVRPNALKRALANLVGNAAAHGTKVAVTLATGPDGGGDIIIDDDGPGIAPDRREEAFKPFSRLDDARNQNEKGVGLGLAIARDVARAHGGEVILDASPMGGLRATIRLPG